MERIGHVCRMEDDRMVKAATFGWMEELENIPKVPGRKRKTVLYCKKLVKEAGMDTTKMAELTSDRKEWKEKDNETSTELVEKPRERGIQ